MGVESLPDFTPPARRRWESFSAHVRHRLLANVRCVHCRHEVTITNFSGTIKGGDLLLVGKCAECVTIFSALMAVNVLPLRKMNVTISA